MKRRQEVELHYEIDHPEKGSLVINGIRGVDGTNTDNLISKINAAIKLLLTNFSVEDGAELKIIIKPAEKDEFANPER